MSNEILDGALKILREKGIVPSEQPIEMVSDQWSEEQLGDSWEPPSVDISLPIAHQEQETKDPRFAFRSSAEFLRGDYQLRWLVKGLLVQGQPGIIGGPKKSLKTSLLVELAYAVATGARFLDRFEVGQRQRVAIMSGESGQYTLKETTLRICEARGIDPDKADVLWEFELPRLADPSDLRALQTAVKNAGVQVLLIDPVYLCILGGMAASGLQASNLFHMGPLFLGVAKSCLEVGCTPLLAHHFKLTRSNPYDEPQLEDLAFAGVQEFARQWMLLGRRERYEPGSGLHRLWLSVGGSSGQSGLWAVDVDEGVIGDDFQGRKWDVTVQTASDVRTTERRQTEAKRTAEQERRAREDEDKLLDALDHLDPHCKGIGFNKVRDSAGLSGTKAKSVLYRLVKAEVLEDIPDLVTTIGSGAKKKVQGIRRIKD